MRPSRKTSAARRQAGGPGERRSVVALLAVLPAGLCISGAQACTPIACAETETCVLGFGASDDAAPEASFQGPAEAATELAPEAAVEAGGEGDSPQPSANDASADAGPDSFDRPTEAGLGPVDAPTDAAGDVEDSPAEVAAEASSPPSTCDTALLPNCDFSQGSGENPPGWTFVTTVGAIGSESAGSYLIALPAAQGAGNATQLLRSESFGTATTGVRTLSFEGKVMSGTQAAWFYAYYSGDPTMRSSYCAAMLSSAWQTFSCQVTIGTGYSDYRIGLDVGGGAGSSIVTVTNFDLH